MKIMPEYEEKIRRAIRDAQAIDPIITIKSMQLMLEKKFNRSFDHRYVTKLLHKVGGEIRTAQERLKIEQRISGIKETNRLMRERLLKIVYWKPSDSADGIKPPFQVDIIMAAEKIVALDIAMLKLEIDNGIYEAPLEIQTANFRYEPLPPEVAQAMIESWRRGGLLTEEKIRAMVPMIIEQPHGDTAGK